MTRLIISTYLIALLTIQTARRTNPVKISLNLSFLSLIIFFVIYLNSRQVWFPFMFVLIFMGGIMIMFMILSSILPNEKSSKNFLRLPMILVVLSTLNFSNYQTQSSIPKQLECMINSNTSMILMMILILAYFFSSIKIASKEESPIRYSSCHNIFNFVN